jgi:hypothetical protein
VKIYTVKQKNNHRISIGELFPVKMYAAKARKAPAIGISLTLSQYVLISTVCKLLNLRQHGGVDGLQRYYKSAQDGLSHEGKPFQQRA